MPDSKDKKSKWGLSNMLHKERPSAATDSTYGSEGDSSTRDSYASAPSLTGSDRSQQPNTFTNDQGQTVTTTTTTTTTTTRGAGGQSQTSGPHTSNMANKLDPRVNSGSDQTEVTEVRRERDRPNVPVKSAMRERSPNPPPQQTRQAPPIQTPARNDPSQNHGDPSSPSGRHNFSYPSRTPPNGQVGAPQGYQQPHQSQQQPGTLQNLKTAAVGIHGVGETLRGTLNSGIDKRFNAPPETMAAHGETLNAGRSEIQSGQLSDTSRQAGGIGNPTKGILRKSGGSGQLRVVNE